MSQWPDPNEWRKQQYRPDEMAQRIYRSTWRAEMEMQVARLNAAFERGDELAFAESARSFAEYAQRMDDRLRWWMTGQEPDTEHARAAPIRRAS